jgi:dihydropteroate synthase
MGILNITRDSFYDGGKYLSDSNILTRVKEMIHEGADIIDIGAMSSRPGAELIPEEQEIKILRSALDLICNEFNDLIISIDSMRSSVIKSILDFPVQIVNDISGGQYDSEIISLCSEYSMPFIMMHMQGMPNNMQINPTYNDVSYEVLVDLRNRVIQAREAGLNDIIIDLGFGFGKTIEHNYQLLSDLASFKFLDCPILIGLSRKSMIYKVLNSDPESALNGTTALHMFALLNGANILRVHDVKEAKEVIALYKKLQESK